MTKRIPIRDGLMPAVLVLLAGSAGAATIGERLPTARILWVQGSNSIMYSTIKSWSPQKVQTGTNPRWSPDGTKIVFYANASTVKIMDSDFTNVKTLMTNGCACSGSAPGTLSWTRDGKYVCAVSSDEYRLLKYRLSDGTTTVIYDARANGWNGEKIGQGGELHIGGRYLLLFWRSPSHTTAIADLQNPGTYINNSSMDGGDCSPAWSSDGTYLMNTLRSGNRPVVKANFNASTGNVSSSTTYIAMNESSYVIHGQRVSNDGKWVAYGGKPSGKDREIYVWEVGTGTKSGVQLTSNSTEDKTPSLFIPTAPADATAPSAPTNLAAAAASSSRIDLTWSAASDAESGIDYYVIYRDGAQVATSSGTSYSDTGLTEWTGYAYQVSAVNGAGMEGAKSGSASESTVGDTTAPTIAGVTSVGDPTQVAVVFSEPVGQAGAETAANYAIDNGVSVSAAALGADLKTVTLTTSALSEGVTYTLTVNGVKDRASTPNTIAANSTATFNYVDQIAITNTAPAGYAWDTLDAGKLAYVDRTYMYVTVPASYVGLDYLQTANDDKSLSSNPFVIFDVNQDVTVYVAFYDGSTPPAWLSGSFANTGDDLVRSGSTDLTFSLWAKDFPAGTVTLGGAEGAGAMYTVVVRPQGGTPPPDSITVIQPNGGEVLTPGDVYYIQWSTVGVDDVVIRYSLDGGISWQPDIVTGLDTSDSNWQNYPWTVPDSPSTAVVMQVISYNLDYPDESDGVFEITAGSTPDTDPPVIGVRTLTIEGDVNDLAVAFVTIDGEAVSVNSGSFSKDLTLTLGAGSFTITAADAAGNSASRTTDVITQ